MKRRLADDDAIDIPMPLRPLILCRALHRCPPSVYGAAVIIIHAWWFRGCPPLSTVETDLQAMAGAHTTLWRRIKPQVIAALAELQPTLARRHAEITASTLRRHESARKARAGRKPIYGKAMLAAKAQRLADTANNSRQLPATIPTQFQGAGTVPEMLAVNARNATADDKVQFSDTA